MSFRLKIVMTLVIMAVLLSGCNLPVDSNVDLKPLPSGKLQAWVDAPLNGTVLPLNMPYPVVCHGADPGGIASVVFSVNGSVTNTYASPEQSQKLLTANFSWLPSIPGRTELECRAQNSSGTWSEPAVSVVMVEGTTPTSSQTPTLTLTPTFTLTPTSTATVTLTPQPVPQNGFVGPPIFIPQQINLPYDCSPSSLTAEIKVFPSKTVRGVILFYRVSDKNSADQSEWASVSMRPAGDDTYQVKFEPIKSGGLMPWLTARWSSTWEGWLSTQFVIQDTNGGLTRSDVYRIVTIAGCH